MTLVLDLEAPLLVAALVHCFDFQLACSADEIQRVAGFVVDINKLPLVFSKRSSI